MGVGSCGSQAVGSSRSRDRTCVPVLTDGLSHWTTIRGTLFNISKYVVQHRCKGAVAICTGRGRREARRCAGWVAPSLPYAGTCFTYVVLSNRYDNMDSHHYLPEEEETEAQVKPSTGGCAGGK